ncbi:MULTISPECIES: heparinase II/III domain-containing protein [unclassified Paenibacillus]|uniref:heparinase II/III domain-containing protein n=1 Tax=unclassified Paenibacillus TaxID=185978 RepID=UPI0030F705E1
MNSAYNGAAEARPFGCYDREQLGEIRSRIEQLPAIAQEYARQQQLSGQFAAREAAVPLSGLGVFRVEPFVFKVPAGAAFLKLAVHVRGQGVARTCGVRLTHSQLGLPVALINGSFGEALNSWTQMPGSGSTIVLEQLSGSGSGLQPSGVTPAGDVPEDPVRSVRISNTAEAEWTVLRYEELLPVCAGDFYGIQTELSLEAPLVNGGIYTGVTFLDSAGQPLGLERLSPLFNRPTLTNWAYLLEAAGADANLYMVSGEEQYAGLAKRKLQYMLADMRIGMDIFRRDGWHDDDTYGAVHIGRGLAATSVIYDQIAGSGVLAAGETAALLADFRYIAAMMMDTAYYRFDLTTFPDEKGGKRSNWNADRATGLGVYALLFPHEAESGAYLEHARSVIDWQLAEVVDAEGAWPENVRYHGAVLHRYFLFFALLKRLRGIDYFRQPKVKAMYRFLIGIVTAEDIIQGGPSGPPVLLTPAVGDANVQEQWFRLLGYAARFYVEEDPQLAAEMIWTWKHGGAPVQDTGAFPLPLVALLYPQPDLPERQPALRSVHYPGIGYVIFRGGEQNLQHYAIYETSPLTYHAHHDEGHFSIWADGVPLTLDAGTGGYYNGDRHWYVSGAAHNVVQFTGETGDLLDGPLQSVCREVRFSEELDYAKSLIPDARSGEYERNFLFIKAGFDAYLVWDRIEGGADSVWNLHTLSTEAEVTEQTIDAVGLGGMRLSAHIAEPALPVITTGEGAVGGAYPLAAQQHFRVHGNAGEDYVVLLHPRAAAAPALRLEPLECEEAGEGVRLYKIARADGAWCVAAINGSTMTRRIRVPGGVPLRLLGTAETALAGGAEAGYTAAQAAEARHSQAGLTVPEDSEADILYLEPGTIQIAVLKGFERV